MVAATSRVTYFHTLDTPNNHFYKKMVVSPNIRQTQVVQTLLANQDFMESKKSLDHCSPVKQRYLYDGWRFFFGGDTWRIIPVSKNHGFRPFGRGPVQPNP